MNRRNFIKFTSYLGLSSLGGIYLSNFSLADDNYSFLLNSELAGKVFYTEKYPGRWSKKIKGHIPTFERKNNIVEISTGHEMNGYEHYIIKHMIFDKKFNLKNEIMFDPLNDSPISKIKISNLKDKIYALSLCNKHDAWISSFDI